MYGSSNFPYQLFLDRLRPERLTSTVIRWSVSSTVIRWSVSSVKALHEDASSPSISSGPSGLAHMFGLKSNTTLSITLFLLLTSLIISVACPIGTKAESNSCLYCDVGSYQDETGQTDCKECPSGFSTPIIGASDVSECTGKYTQCTNIKLGMHGILKVL